MFMLVDTLRRIATDPIATADLWAPVVAPLVALALLLAFHTVSKALTWRCDIATRECMTR